MHGYILVRTILGKAIDVLEEIQKVKGVTCACAVTGAYDVIATYEVKNLTDVGDVVVKGIQDIIGVYTTQTTVCVSCKS